MTVPTIEVRSLSDGRVELIIKRHDGQHQLSQTFSKGEAVFVEHTLAPVLRGALADAFHAGVAHAQEVAS